MSKVQIKDVFKLQMGKTPPRKNYAYWYRGSLPHTRHKSPHMPVFKSSQNVVRTKG